DNAPAAAEASVTHGRYRPDPRNSSYFTAAADPRLCPSPLCGGFWVASVNQTYTVCANGSAAARCYVAEIDLSAAGLSAEQAVKVRGAAGHLLLRGSIGPSEFGAFGNLGVLRADEAWIGHPKIVATGNFYRATSTGIVCFTYPCPTVKIAPLNRAK